MKVKVQTFAFLKEKLGNEFTIDLPEKASVKVLLQKLIKEHPQLEQVLKHSLIAIEDKMVNEDAIIYESNLVLLMPPASGG